ncbi:MAG: ribonuclease J [Fimbriimonadaceae bacterium]
MGLVEVIPFGGVEEIGKSCAAVRQGDDMVVIDCGLSFPNEEMYGVDIIIPDFSYLIEHKDQLRGVFLTHGHEDHVGSLGYLLRSVNVPVYASEFVQALIRPKLEELLDIKKVEFVTIKPRDVIQAGSLTVEPIRITHSIPETTCMAVRTEHGIILFTTDFKFDFTPVDGRLSDITRLGELGQEGVLLLLSDSTNVERPGWGPSERTVSMGLRKHFTEAKGRVLLTTFASNIHRMQQVFDVAADTGRKVAVVGRRMEQNLDVCARLGYVQIPKGVHVRLEDIRRYPKDKIAILTTGSQGEPLSALVRMSKDEYSRLRIEAGDTVLYSARPIPGNEGAIWRTVNRLFRLGAKVIYEDSTPIHVSGHAYQEELKMMINLTRPYYVAPVHGEPRHQSMYVDMARGMGYPEHRTITMADGRALVLDEKSWSFGDRITAGAVLVDNSGTPGVTPEVLRDRASLANEGVVTITFGLDVERGEVVGDLDVHARGFHGPDGILDEVINVVDRVLDAMPPTDLKDVNLVRHAVADEVRKFLQKRTSMRPIIMPSVIEV